MSTVDNVLGPIGDDEMDIYRGNPPSPILARSPSPALSRSSSSSSPSSTGGGRLGAIAAVVESAISRWARRRSSSSSTSSSSSSAPSRSSTFTNPRTRARLRRRRSAGTFDSSQSGYDIAARITRFRAREESRQTPRNFILYLPPPSAFSFAQPAEYEEKGVTRSTSLPHVLSQLDAALKKAGKSRRNHEKRFMPRNTRPHGRTNPKDFLGPRMSVKAVAPQIRRDSSSSQAHQHLVKPKAWFLDVASPTWEDMREIGKLLHLHPLTLEDVLQRDPREKLEFFPKLGYYFISFRAIESQQGRDRRRAKESRESINGLSEDDGTVGEANVYVAVFEKGICAFHFTDISEHMDHVRNRIRFLQDTVNMTSDRIAHSILDTVVDSFFPFLKEIEREVIAIEDLVLANKTLATPPSSTDTPVVSFSPSQSRPLFEAEEKQGSIQLNEKVPTHSIPTAQTRFSLPPVTFPLFLRRIKRAIGRRWKRLSTSSERGGTPPNLHHTLARRIARTSKLVTSLTRLLGAKPEVIAQIQKRLIASSTSKLAHNPRSNEDADLAIYMGDIRDHILALQVSLAHHERVLSQSHPTYIAQLNADLAISKNSIDIALMCLTAVIIGCSCVQVLTGLCSLNVTIPTDFHGPGGTFHVFTIVISLSIFILSAFVALIRYWWIQSINRHRKVL